MPLLFLLTFAFAVRPAFGDVFYAYDEVGRLIAVVDSNGAGAKYTYDAVGNLLSITRFTTAGAPALGSIVPAQGEAGATLALTVGGENLFHTEGVGSDNPEVTLLASSVTAVVPDQLTLFVRIAAEARLGVTTTFTARTPFGSASIGFTVIQPPVVLTRLIPETGDVGTRVTIEGSGLISSAGPTSVTFAGPNGRIPAAPILSLTATQLTVQVPADFVTGPVRVAVGPKVSNDFLFSEAGS